MEADKLQAPIFPLDFSAEGWAGEDVVRWVFLGGLAATNRTGWDESVSYVLGKLDGTNPRMPVFVASSTRGMLHTLASFLHDMKPRLSASTEKPPIVWARIAMQYWLSHGGYHKRFVSKFCDWLKEQGNVDVRVAPRRRLRTDSGSETTSPARGRGKAKQIVIPAFLLDPFPATNLFRQSVSVCPVEKQAAKPSAPKAVAPHEKLEEMLGPNVTSCVRWVIEKAVTSRSIPSLSARRDPKTDRYQYTGRHIDLCEAIFQRYKEETAQYRRSTLERAIRGFVISRRSWK